MRNMWYWVIGFLLLLAIGYFVYSTVYDSNLVPTGSTIYHEDVLPRENPQNQNNADNLQVLVEDDLSELEETGNF